MPSLRRRHKVPTETGLTEAPETAHSRLTRRRSQRTFYAVTPTYWERYLARQTGRRDGRRGTIPDPEHGHTAHSHGIESKFRTTAEIEQIELARILAKTDERRERLATELDLLHVTLEAALDRATNAPEPAIHSCQPTSTNDADIELESVSNSPQPLTSTPPVHGSASSRSKSRLSMSSVPIKSTSPITASTAIR